MMARKSNASGSHGFVIRQDWYQISKSSRILLVIVTLLLTFITFFLPAIYFKSSISLELTFEKAYRVQETAAWVFALASILVLVPLLFKGMQPFGLVLSLIALATQIILFLGFIFLLQQALNDPTVLAGMGFQVYCLPVGDYWDCTSGLSGHLEIADFVYLINSVFTFLLVMIYGTEAYLNVRKRKREELTKK